MKVHLGLQTTQWTEKRNYIYANYSFTSFSRFCRYADGKVIQIVKYQTAFNNSSLHKGDQELWSNFKVLCSTVNTSIRTITSLGA